MDSVQAIPEHSRAKLDVFVQVEPKQARLSASKREWLLEMIGASDCHPEEYNAYTTLKAQEQRRESVRNLGDSRGKLGCAFGDTKCSSCTTVI